MIRQAVREASLARLSRATPLHSPPKLIAPLALHASRSQIRQLRAVRRSNGPRSSRQAEPTQFSKGTPLASEEAPLETSSLALDTSNGRPEADQHGILDRANSAGAAELVSAPTLVVCRQVEMMNIFIGFEQSNKYIMYDSQGGIAGYIAEDSNRLSGTMIRNLAGTHRPFSCVVMDAKGNVVLKVTRPFAFINSYIRVFLVEDGTETLIGEVRQVFHFIRRKYELFLKRNEGMTQFGAIDEPVLSWDFAVKDADGSTCGSISRNMRGLVRELFTDTGHYVLRMSQTAVLSSKEVVSEGESAEAKAAIAATESRALVGIQKRPMLLDERAVLLATAVAVDFDYFSKMSNNHGGMGMPMFIPLGGSYGTGETTNPSSPDAQTGSESNIPGNVDGTDQAAEAGQSEPQQEPTSGNWWDEPAAQPQEQN